MAAIEIFEAQFYEKVQRGVVTVNFFSESCMNCLMMSPVIDGLEEKFSPHVKFFKVNIEENPTIVKELAICTTPTIIVLKDGEIVHRECGGIFEEEFENMICEMIGLRV